MRIGRRKNQANLKKTRKTLLFFAPRPSNGSIGSPAGAEVLSQNLILKSPSDPKDTTQYGT
jgi:hypothetical protein